MSIGRAFKAFFGDPHWLKKTGLGVLIMLIPYVGAVAFMGFEFRYLREVAWGRDERLPEWNEFVELLKTGLYGFVAGLVYSLPLSLLIGIIAAVVAVIGAGAVAYAQSIASIVWLVIAIFLVFMILSLLMSGILWPVYAHVALYNNMQAGFDFKGIWARTRANSATFWRAFGKSILLMLVTMGATTVMFGLIGAVFGLSVANANPDQASLGVLLLLPLELLAFFVISFVSFPVGVMNNHIWGEYARIAYSLDSSAVSEAGMAATYAEQPANDYLPPPPTT